MTTVPDWRPGAIFHKPVLDEDGLATGREITVYPLLWGNGRLCEGVLAEITYDQEWSYETIGEAVHAAEEWDGREGTSPPGSFTNYRCVHNGDRISHAHGADEKELDTEALVRQQFPDVSRAMREAGVRAGEASRRLSEQAARMSETLVTIQEFGKDEPVGWIDSSGKFHDGQPPE